MSTTNLDQNLGLAISPLDGRYRTQLEPLAKLVGEGGLVARRIQVEVCWLLHLAKVPGIGFTLTPDVKAALEQLKEEFRSPIFYERVKLKEKVTQHDVKAVEYVLAEELKKHGASNEVLAHIHFGCTSEDINNLSYALMLREARDAVVLPEFINVMASLAGMARQYAEVPMLARTHGQPATPTTLGKELAVFVQRLQRQAQEWRQVSLQGKMNGAVGAYNAHVAAYPEIDWPKVSRSFVESLGLEFNPLTTQIENHDSVAEYCDALKRLNAITIDLAQDIWAYISWDYLQQKPKDGEVGSSTMPHKVNPIDFENAEGNLGVANALAEFFARKLPISRLQRDLSDSTVLRNVGTMLGHSLLATKSLQKGLSKITANEAALSRDLEATPQVLAEAVQMVMRRYGIADAYEQLKAKTRGQAVSLSDLQAFVRQTTLPKEAKDRLLALTPAQYTGLAAKLARETTVGKT